MGWITERCPKTPLLNNEKKLSSKTDVILQFDGYALQCYTIFEDGDFTITVDFVSCFVSVGHSNNLVDECSEQF